MADTKSCRDCVHDNPDDYENHCKLCITNNRINWKKQQERVRVFRAKKKAEATGQT